MQNGDQRNNEGFFKLVKKNQNKGIINIAVN